VTPLLTYVETPNQCRLASRLAGVLAEVGLRLDVAFLPKILGGSLASHVRRIGHGFTYPLDDQLPSGLSKPALYERFDVIRERFTPIVEQYALFVCWNDGTNTARRLVPVARAAEVPVAVVQDGFLDQVPEVRDPWTRQALRWVGSPLLEHDVHVPGLAEWIRRRAYRRFNFGRTGADHYFVYGPAMRRKLHVLMGIDPDRVETIGSPDLSAGATAFAAEPFAELGQHGPLRILYLDQCHVAHGKIPRRDWEGAYPRLMRVLSRHDVTVKLHPGEAPDVRRWILQRVGGSVKLLTEGFSQDLDWSEFDVVVTATSSSFLDALAARVPVVLFRFPGLVESFPRLSSSVVQSCPTLDDLEDFLAELDCRRRFVGSGDGVSLQWLFALGPDGSFERRLAQRLRELSGHRQEMEPPGSRRGAVLGSEASEGGAWALEG